MNTSPELIALGILLVLAVGIIGYAIYEVLDTAGFFAFAARVREGMCWWFCRLRGGHVFDSSKSWITGYDREPDLLIDEEYNTCQRRFCGLAVSHILRDPWEPKQGDLVPADHA